jgi:hypothetical protein
MVFLETLRYHRHMSWRTEADDEFLASHRSGVMRWLRRHFKIFAPAGEAFSWADTGPYAGAPRNPRLRADENDKGYSTVRYATSPDTSWQADSWQSPSWMPSARAARARARRNVV